MPTTNLTDVIDTLQKAVSDDPANAAAQFRAHAVAGDAVDTTIRINKHTFKQDEPVPFGGADAAPGPVDYALAGLASCQAVVYKYWAAKTGVQIDSLAVDVEGDFDFRTMFGFDGGGRAGLSDVHVKVTIGGPESEQRYQELQQLVDEHCPVYDLIANATPLTTALTVTS